VDEEAFHQGRAGRVLIGDFGFRIETPQPLEQSGGFFLARSITMIARSANESAR
jgi:hypothetical protein